MNKNPEKNPEIPNDYNFKCNGCESVFRKNWELKKHLDQMHSQKLTPLKSANVDTENIILYKRHIGKVKHTKLSVITLKSIPNNRFLIEVKFLEKNENKLKFRHVCSLYIFAKNRTAIKTCYLV